MRYVIQPLLRIGLLVPFFTELCKFPVTAMKKSRGLMCISLAYSIKIQK